MILKNSLLKKHNIFSLFTLLFLALSILLCSYKYGKDDPKHKVKTIVIDPGHGGKDPGCSGVAHSEKEVALAVALKLEKYINENMKDVKVILTRKTDVFVDLEDRAKIANDNNADLFISIHCNADGNPVMVRDKKTGKMRPKTFKNKRGKLVVVEVPNPIPYGSATYVMGLKNEDGKMKVAQRENSAMLLEDNYEKKYQGFDPNSEESYIIMSNYTSSYVIQSAGLALKIQEQYSKKAGRVDKGVHRQSIWVLWRTSMPSVLTEIGYLTNPQEEKFIGSDKGQDYVAACLFRAFRKYKDEQDGSKKNYDDAIENQKELEKEVYATPTVTNPEEQAIVEEAKDTIELATTKPADNLKEKQEAEKITKAKELAEKKAKLELERLAAEKTAKEKATADALEKEKQESILKKYKQLIVMADMNLKNKHYDDALNFYKEAENNNVNKDTYPTQKIKEIESIQQKITEAKADTLKKETPVVVNTTDIIFKVQFASTDKEMDVKAKYANVNDVAFYKAGVVFKYTSGNYKNMNDASKQQSKLRELGYKDCFVVAFKNGSRMDINEAKKAMGN